MNLYKEVGDTLIFTGIVYFIFNAFNMTFLLTITSQKPLQETKIVTIATLSSNLVYLILLIWLIYNTIKLGQEVKTTTMNLGLIFLMISGLILLVIDIYIVGLIYYGLFEGNTGGFWTVFGPFEVLLGGGIFATIFQLAGLAILGIGLREIGENLGSSNLKTGGLLVILGFIPFLYPIGLIVSGYAFRQLL